jgi:hypothetical protein
MRRPHGPGEQEGMELLEPSPGVAARASAASIRRRPPHDVTHVPGLFGVSAPRRSECGYPAFGQSPDGVPLDILQARQ